LLGIRIEENYFLKGQTSPLKYTVLAGLSLVTCTPFLASSSRWVILTRAATGDPEAVEDFVKRPPSGSAYNQRPIARERSFERLGEDADRQLQTRNISLDSKWGGTEQNQAEGMVLALLELYSTSPEPYIVLRDALDTVLWIGWTPYVA
jgi:hypothetical protein